MTYCPGAAGQSDSPAWEPRLSTPHYSDRVFTLGGHISRGIFFGRHVNPLPSRRGRTRLSTAPPTHAAAGAFKTSPSPPSAQESMHWKSTRAHNSPVRRDALCVVGPDQLDRRTEKRQRGGLPHSWSFLYRLLFFGG